MWRPSLRLVYQSVWNDTRTLLRDAPAFALIALSINVMLGVLTFDETSNAGSDKIFRILVDGFATTPLIPVHMAFYRLLILREPPSSYTSYFSSSRFPRYLAWSAVFWLIRPIGAFLPFDNLVAAGLYIGAAVVMFILVIRLVLLLPALAAGAQDFAVKDALLDTKGRFWIIFLILFAAGLPVLFIGLLVFGAQWQLGWDSPHSFGRAAISSVFAFGADLVVIAINGRLFEWYGDRVKRDGSAAG